MMPDQQQRQVVEQKIPKGRLRLYNIQTLQLCFTLLTLFSNTICRAMDAHLKA